MKNESCVLRVRYLNRLDRANWRISWGKYGGTVIAVIGPGGGEREDKNRRKARIAVEMEGEE